MGYTEVDLVEKNILTSTYRALLNSSRMYDNTISACAVSISTKGTCASIGDIAVRGNCEVIVSTIADIASSAQFYRDREGRKRPAHIFYIAICSDIKLLYANIKHIDKVSAYLKNAYEPVYIDIGDCTRIVEYAGTAEEYHRICKRAGVLVYTSTGIIRQRLKDNWQRQSTWNYERIQALYPEEPFYRACMKWLFRGGKVFCEAESDVYTDINAADITSAHVWHMLTEHYPTTRFERVDENKAISAIYSGLSVILDITYFRVSPRLDIGWETKAIELDKPVWDGRGVLYARKMRVMITEVDWMTYQKVYKWEGCTVNAAWIAHSNPLPAYLRKTIKETLIHKQQLKHWGVSGEEYTQAKRDVNMLFGMTAQKLNLTTCTADGKGIAQAYDKAISHKILSPFWAVWTAAFTRYQQADMIYKLVGHGARVLYGDTDSVYAECDKNVFEAVISAENIRISARNIADNLKGELSDLGMWTIDQYSKFKALGCKRYMYQDAYGQLHYKCSGILSQALDGITFKEFCEGREIKNARRILCKDSDLPAYYRYESVSLSTCASDIELQHWYMRNVLKL